MKEKYEYFARDLQSSPIPQHFIMNAFISGFKEKFGFKLNCGFTDKKKMIEYFTIPSEMDDFVKKISKKAEENKNFINYIHQKIEKSADKLNKFSKENFYKKDLTKYSNKKLWQLYEKFYNLDIDVYTYGVFIFFLGFRDDSYSLKRINKILNKKVKSADIKKKYLSIITTPTKPTFNRHEATALLKLSEIIWKDKKAKNQLLYGVLENFQQLFPDLWKKICKHREKYAFIFYNYEGPAFDEYYFAVQIKDILKKGNPAKILKEKQEELNKTKREINKIYRKLKFTKEKKKIAQEAQLIAYLQPQRKMRQFRSNFEMEGFLKEIAKRLNISLNQVRFMLPSEIKKYLNTNKEVNADILNERYKLCMYLNNKNGKPLILSGKKAKSFIKNNIKIEKKRIKAKSLAGTPACKGRVRGAVRIVNTLEESRKLKKGDVLVSYATNPTLVPAMRLSEAVVTEEGGLTCHAAIITRELGKPCLVGVENLMDFVKNGDRVEVDAEKGINESPRRKRTGYPLE